MIKLIGIMVVFSICGVIVGYVAGQNEVKAQRPKGKSINQLTDAEFEKLKGAVDYEYKQREEREPFQEFKKEDKRK